MADGSIIIDTEIDSDGLNSDLASINRNMKSVFKNLAKVAVTGALVAGTAITGLAVSSTKDFAVFQSQMNEVFTLLPDLTEDAMKSMEKDVQSFSKEMKVLPEEVVPALYQAISAGVPKENVFDFLEVAQKAAKGGVTELTTAVDGISSVINSYGTDILSATEASDLMFTAVKNGKTSFEEMSASLFQVIPTASSLGVEFGNVTAALASMTAQGTPTSVATTQLRSLFVELSKAGGKTSKTFEKISGKTFKQFVAEGGNVQDALQLMEKESETLGVGINDLFSSVEAGGAALALTGKGAENFTKNLVDMENAAGATDTAYDTMNKGISVSVESLMANFAVLKLRIGEQLAPIVEVLTNKFADFVANEELVDAVVNTVINTLTFLADALKLIIDTTITVATWMKEHQALLQIAAVAVATLTVAIIAYNVAMAITATGLTIASAATVVMTTAATAFGAVMAFITSPITLVILAIGALIAVGILVVKNWDEIKTFFIKFWETIKELFRKSVDAVGEYFKNLWIDIKSSFKEGIDNIMGFFTDLFLGMVNIFSGINEVGRNIVLGLWEGIRNMGGWIKDKIFGFFGGILDSAKEALGIHSPSVVFKKEVGNNIALGVGEGFEDKFKNVNKKVVDSMRGLTKKVSANVSGGMRPAFAGGGSSNSTTNSFEGMFSGATFSVRSEADINNIATKTSRKILNDKVKSARGNGRAR